MVWRDANDSPKYASALTGGSKTYTDYLRADEGQSLLARDLRFATIAKRKNRFVRVRSVDVRQRPGFLFDKPNQTRGHNPKTIGR